MRARTRARAAASVAAALLASGAVLPARADPPPLRYDARDDGALAAGATALWIASELAKGRLAPAPCRWCAENRLDGRVRELLVWERPDRAARASDAVAFGVVPAAMAAHQLLAARAAGATKEGFVDILLVAEAAAISVDLNQIVKFSAGRQRPFVHHASPDRRAEADDNLSFYSGHSTLTFSIAAAAGTVSDLRGYKSAPWVWGAGMTLAAATAYLRIAADKHYLTDVLTGAALGTAGGIALPRLLHGRKSDGGPGGATVTAAPLGVVIVF
jgi:membrane-associated phospholipid phosphatase